MDFSAIMGGMGGGSNGSAPVSSSANSSVTFPQAETGTNKTLIWILAGAAALLVLVLVMKK